MDGKVWQCKQGEHMGSWGNYCGDLLIFLTFNDTSFWWEWEVFREEACHMKIKKKKTISYKFQYKLLNKQRKGSDS